MRFHFFLLFLLLPVYGYSQKGQPAHISFVPVYNSQRIVPDETWYPLPGGDSVQFEVFRWYISDMTFQYKGAIVYREANSYHLCDIADANTLNYSIALPERLKYDAISFNLGIDSLTNAAGAGSGVLDATNGMYWAWQSGYINLKLEGRSNLCPTRKNRFQLHLGGYMLQDNALQRITLPAMPGNDIVINIPLDKLLQTIDLRKQHSIMIPCPEAVSLSKTMAGLFQTAP